MSPPQVTGSGTPDDPWLLTTPPGGSTFQAHRDETADPPALVVKVGSTELRYHVSAITDLHEMLAHLAPPLKSPKEMSSFDVPISALICPPVRTTI